MCKLLWIKVFLYRRYNYEVKTLNTGLLLSTSDIMRRRTQYVYHIFLLIKTKI